MSFRLVRSKCLVEDMSIERVSALHLSCIRSYQNVFVQCQCGFSDTVVKRFMTIYKVQEC